MSKYIGNIPVPNATQSRTRIVATSGQTTFTTSDSYTPGYIDVFLGGVKLDSSEFTATNGTTVVLASGANTGQIFESISYTTFNATVTTASEASGAFNLESYTTSERDALTGIEAGDIIYNTTLAEVEFYNGTLWKKINSVTPTLSSITGNLTPGTETTLTLTGSGFLTSNLVVNFLQASDAIDVDVSVTPTSSTSASVTVPSSVYSNVTNGNVVSISVTNSDTISSNTVTKTAIEYPTGGTVTTDGSYRIHTFTSSGTFTVPSPTSISNVEYLVIAGGGGGGVANGGGAGGGAGGYRSSVSGESSGGGSSAETALTLSPASYTVTIGAGGAGNTHSGTIGSRGDAGSDSVFSTITSVGGGYGGGDNSKAGGSGGSGGGEARFSGNGGGGSATSGQGYAGGAGGSNTGGGGGGAGGAGTAGSGSSLRGGAGGVGVESSINGTATYRAGGGGGGAEAPSDDLGGIGGTGGGGKGGQAGSIGSTPTAGEVNTGSGGGASGDYNTGGSHNGKAGGSGIVIIRYQL